MLADLVASAGARDDAELTIAFGKAAAAVMEQHVKADADLLVVGKRPRLAWVDALRGSVTSRVLRAGTADVLALPMPPLAPTESWRMPDFARRAVQ